MELFPCLVDMRFKGVRVDTKKAETLGLDLKKRRESIIKGIKRRTGVSLEIWAADSVEKLLHKLKITDYTSTPKSGRVSLSKSYLESHPNVYLKLIDIDPNIYMVRVWLARALSDTDYKKSLLLLEEAISISPSQNDAYREIIRIAQTYCFDLVCFTKFC